MYNYKLTYSLTDFEYNEKTSKTKYFSSFDKAIEAIKRTVESPEQVQFKTNLNKQNEYISFPEQVYHKHAFSKDRLIELEMIEKNKVNYKYL